MSEPNRRRPSADPPKSAVAALKRLRRGAPQAARMAHTEPGSPAGRLPPEPHTLRLVLFDDVDELDQGATAAAEWRITGGPRVRAALLGVLNQAVAELETRYAAALRAASAGRGGRATP